MPQLKAWSFSRWDVYRKCPFRAKLAFLDKIPEPERPLPKGKTEHYNDRGSRVHEGMELYVRGEGELPEESAKYFQAEMDILKNLYAQNLVSLEGEWGFDKDWAAVAYRSSDIWLRVKLDALVWRRPHEVVAIDYKTGKRFGNEIKHSEQMQLYALATLLKYPQVQLVHTELWYLDLDDLARITYTREQGLRLFKKFDEEGKKITSELIWPARPNIFTCKWCPYNNPEHCLNGV